MAIDHRLRCSTVIYGGSLAVRKSLRVIIFIVVRRIRSIFSAASVNRRVAGSNPAWGASPV